MEMFQIAVLMTNYSFSDCRGILLGLLGMNQTSCSYDSFTAPWKPAEKKVGIAVDTKLNIIQQCSLVTNKLTSTLNYIMRTVTTRPFIPVYWVAMDPKLDYCDQFWAPQLKKGHDLQERLREMCLFHLEKKRSKGSLRENQSNWKKVLTLSKGGRHKVKGEMPKTACLRASN